jgi:predicted metalloprotease with PDZ domain
LGARYTGEQTGVRLTAVLDEGSAQACGLSAGDLLVALDGLMVSEGSIEKRLARLGVGESVNVHAFRRDELMEFDMTLLPAPDDTCELWLLEDLDSVTDQRRKTWLNLQS